MVAANDGPPGPPPAGDNPAQGVGAGGVHAAAGGGHKNTNNLATKGDDRIYWKHYGNEGARFSTSTRE